MYIVPGCEASLPPFDWCFQFFTIWLWILIQLSLAFSRTMCQKFTKYNQSTQIFLLLCRMILRHHCVLLIFASFAITVHSDVLGKGKKFLVMGELGKLKRVAKSPWQSILYTRRRYRRYVQFVKLYMVAQCLKFTRKVSFSRTKKSHDKIREMLFTFKLHITSSFWRNFSQTRIVNKRSSLRSQCCKMRLLAKLSTTVRYRAKMALLRGEKGNKE